MKQEITQHQRIIRLLKRRPKSGATYHDMQLHCHVNWPHTRIIELESKGYRFKKRYEQVKGCRPFLRIWLVSEPQQLRKAA